MKLVVVSHTAHYRRRNGEIVGWGPTVRELSSLSTIFETVIHVAPLHDCEAPASALPYTSSNVTLVPLRPAGGTGWLDKIRLVGIVPEYARVIRRAASDADVLHIRCPANVSLVALLMTIRRGWLPRRVWVKYAGDWRPTHDDPWSFLFQRWWARRATDFVVTINGSWPDQPPHIHTMYNPCLTEVELAEGRKAAATKALSQPLRLLFVGALIESKGAFTAVEILKHLLSRGIKAEMDVVGDGPLRRAIEVACASTNGVRLHGWRSRLDLGQLYSGAHFILLPSRGEGWPKVLSEAMAHGVVPLASAVGSISQHLTAFKVGVAVTGRDPALFASAVEAYLGSKTRWQLESARGLDACANFTYENYLSTVRGLVLNA